MLILVVDADFKSVLQFFNIKGLLIVATLFIYFVFFNTFLIVY